MWFSRQFGVVGMIRVRVTRVTAIEKNRAWLQTTVVPGESNPVHIELDTESQVPSVRYQQGIK